MLRRTPISKRTYTRFPYTSLFRSARDHRADAVDAALLLERPRRRALPLELLRHVPRRLAARGLDQDHLAWGRGDLWPLRLHDPPPGRAHGRSEEHTSELQSLMRISYAVFCLTKQKELLQISS